MPSGHVQLTAFQHFWTAVDVDVGDVGDIVALLFQPADHRVFDQCAFVQIHRVRAIEADLIAAVPAERFGSGQLVDVQTDPAPGVVGLPTRDVSLHEKRCLSSGFANHEGNVALESVIRSELEQVVAALPRSIHGELERGCPRALDQARHGADARFGLGGDADRITRADQAAAESLVISDAVQIPAYLSRTADIHSNGDHFADARRGGRSVTLDLSIVGWALQAEIARTRQAIFDADRRFDQLGRDDLMGADRGRLDWRSAASRLP